MSMSIEEPAQSHFTESEINLIAKFTAFKYKTFEEAKLEYDAIKDAIDTREDKLAKAKKELGITGDDFTYLLKTAEAAVEANPDRENQIWDAYWTIKDKPSLERLEEAEKQMALANEINLADVLLHWPKDWEWKFAPIWLGLGGDSLSAAKWHEMGWPIEFLIFEQDLPGDWTGNIHERVKKIDPPYSPWEVIW
jgi:hypothetical protein